jgi:hypothetical protein
MNEEDDEEGEEDGTSDWRYPFITYIFPVVVTTGQIFAVDASGEEPQVNLVPWASLKRNFSSNELNSTLWADVVSFEHFDDYLKTRVMAIVNHAKDVLVANIHLYDPEWLLAHMGQPEQSDFFNSWLNDVRANRKAPLIVTQEKLKDECTYQAVAIWPDV